MIAKDLIKGDSALSLLKNTEKELTLTQQKSKRQDSLIASYRLKERNYMMQIGNERQKVEGWQEQYQVLQKENKRLKAKYRFTKIVSYAIIGGLGYLYITK
jgi:hypothetical protein